MYLLILVVEMLYIPRGSLPQYNIVVYSPSSYQSPPRIHNTPRFM